MEIISMHHPIKRINKLHYKVQSQSSDIIWYDIRKKYGRNLGGRQDGKWICSCPDFRLHQIQCKHVCAILFSKKIRRKIISQDVIPQLVIGSCSNSIECIKCKGTKLVKDGKRYNKKGVSQKYLCRGCDYRFVVNTGFENSKKDPNIICASIDLYFKGVSLRKVADHIEQFQGVSISNVSVLRWVQRFAEVVGPFVDSLVPPHLGGVYQVDEMVVHVRRSKGKGNFQWLWNFMDDSTRFWVSSMLSQRRGVVDARAVFADAKSKVQQTRAIIHDGLLSYDRAFQKEYYTQRSPRVKNIRSISVRNEGLNSRVERLNGTIRDREKTMRGMHTKESAQKIIEAIRIHYNFCREHSTFKKTPAEQAGLWIDLGQHKIKSLMELASKNTSK